MSLIWSKDDNSKRPHPRDLVRNCGQLLGRLDDVFPCIYLAHFGVRGRDMRRRLIEENSHGLFSVGEQLKNGNRPGVAPRNGLLLPVRLCRNEQARTALEAIAKLVGDGKTGTMASRRRDVQALLDKGFAGQWEVSDTEPLDNHVVFQPSPGLFHTLHESFDYVTEVIDNEAGNVRITNTARFRWKQYGELLEWFNTLGGTGRLREWTTLAPYFVCGNAAALRSYNMDRWAQAGLQRPVEAPGKWFTIRPDVADGDIAIRMEMRVAGWAKLHLTLNGKAVEIWLSDVFDPLPELVAWSREIDEGDLPVQMEIDEEGQEAVLTVLSTDDPARVLLRVTRKDENEILLEGIVSRADLGAKLRAELVRFFTSEFDPREWDERGDIDDGDAEDDGAEEGDGYIPMNERISAKAQVLGNPWLASAIPSATKDSSP